MRELIVATNPAAKRKRARTPKQKAATRKLVALNRRRGGGTTRKRTRKATTTRRRAAPASRRRAPQRRSNPLVRRRNQALFGRGGFGNVINNQIMPALVGGAGGVANDVLYGFLPIPEQFKVGNFRHVGKAASALGLAWVARFVVNKRTADQIGAGALTVVGYNVVRELVARFAPDINMGMFLDPSMGMFLDPSMGYADTSYNNGMGYASPGLNPDYPLAAFSRRGNAGVPGAGVVVPPQLMTEKPYGPEAMYSTSRAAGYQDTDAGGYGEFQ